MRLIIEGWRFLPHSYGVVDQFLCMELRRRADVELFHRDIPYIDSKLSAEPATLGDEQIASDLAQIPTACADQPTDATLRLFVPLNFAPASTGRTLVFGTAEFGAFDENQIGVSSLASLNAQPDLAVMTPSEWSRSGFIRGGADPDKVVVIPHGVDPLLFCPADASQRAALRRERGWDDDFVFLNIGALTANKGVVQLLQAFAALTRDFPNARLVLKGLDRLYRSASCLDEYLAVLSQQDRERIAPRLTYLGKTMAYAQTAALYQGADAYVTPYHAEGFNLPVLEAAACGLPIICTGGGPTDEFTDASFALRIASRLQRATINGIPAAQELAPDVEHLTQLMRQLIEYPAAIARARLAGPAFVSARFTWKHIADRLLAFLSDPHAAAWRARPVPAPIFPRRNPAAHVSELQAQAWKSYQAGEPAEARRLCMKLLRQVPLSVDAIYLLGVLAIDSGSPQEALLHFHQAATLHPEVAMYHNALGEAYSAVGWPPEAAECFHAALQLNPALAAAHNSLGRLAMDRGDAEGAINSFRAAIAAQPTYARAHLNLGLVLHSRGEAAAAKASFVEAIRLHPRYAIAHNNLGALLQGQGQLDGAIAEFRKAIALEITYPEAHFNLGSALLSQGDATDAESCFREAIRLRPTYVRAHATLGLLLQDDGRLEEALAHYDEALRLRPALAETHRHRGEVLEDLGRLPEALASFQAAAGADASHADASHNVVRLLEKLGRQDKATQSWERALLACRDDGERIRMVLSTPAIFQSVQDMRIQRRRLEDGLTLLEQQNLSIVDPLTQINTTNFFAAYHGMDDRAIQTRLARLNLRAAPSLAYVAPHCRDGSAEKSGEPLRIGFISSFFHMHTIGEVNLGFIKNLSREICRVILLPLPGPSDAISTYIRQSADAVVPLAPSLESARRQIAEQRLDVLFYTDIGMDPFTYFLAFSRLAPVQCVTWGHPDTTGIPALDYFISSDLEPPDPDSHYSEKLVRLGGLPTYYHAPAFFPPAKSRAYFRLDEHEHLYLCSQAPFKIHPDYDALLGEILRADPRGRVLFIRSQNPQWTHQLRRRLRRSLPREFDRIQFLPHQGGQDYLHLLNVVDVLLDSTHFGGGNTHLKAFSVGTPVVTLPGAFARSRVATACYRKMGIDDCIAANGDEYVRIAVRMGTDRDWRQQIHARILEKRHVLFEDAGILRELEQFFIRAVKDQRFTL